MEKCVHLQSRRSMVRILIVLYSYVTQALSDYSTVVGKSLCYIASTINILTIGLRL